MDWSSLYPAFVDTDSVGENEIATALDASEVQRVPSLTKQVEIADVGCGFGGLLFALAPKFPHTLAIGMLPIVLLASLSIDCSVTLLAMQTI
jgi:tRNA (guanine-N7-)-methyltransferase